MIGGSFQDSVKLNNTVFSMFSVCREEYGLRDDFETGCSAALQILAIKSKIINNNIFVVLKCNIFWK